MTTSKQDLFDMLGLTQAPAQRNHNQGRAIDPVSPVDANSYETASQAPAADTALVLDRWDRERGAHCLETSPNLKQTGLDELAVADLHAAAFLQQPELTEACTDNRRHEFIRTLLESPDYKVLHESTQANTLASEMAATEFGQQFAQLLKNDQKRKTEGKDNPGQSNMACAQAVSKALKQSTKEVDELNNMQSALGLGGNGPNESSVPPTQIAELFNKIKNSEYLRRITELAGRYRRSAQAKQRTKASHGMDDMVGVAMDGDVGRLLPLERAMLADEDFELDAMRRLVERQSMCREYRGVEKLAKGPIVVCVDESGSMSGEPVHNAKAFALAMAWIAQHQRRWCALIGYAGGTKGNVLVLPPGKWDRNALCDWLEHFYGGGTTMDVPLKELPTDYWEAIKAPKGKTDLVIITDAIVNVPTEMERTFLDWKHREQVKTFTLVIGQTTAGGLARVSDEVHLIKSIEVGSSAVQACFSV